MSGLRLGEITHIRWEDVDLARREITIRSHADFRTKKDGLRIVPMHPAIEAILNRRTRNLDSQYVFYETKESFASHLITRYRQRAGLPSAIHFHSLRHTFATWLAQQGERLEVIQKLLGHSSISVTQIYAHLSGRDLHASVNRIQSGVFEV